jgi:Inovirus Coat protein B
MNRNLKTVVSRVLAVALVAGVSAVQAAAIDVSGTVTTIGEQLVPIGLIGLAVMGIMVAVKAFKWVRAAMS